MVNNPLSSLPVVAKGISYFRTHWWLFLSELVVVFGISLYIYKTTPPMYQSQASVLIDSSKKALAQTVLTPSSQNYMQKRQNTAVLLTSQDAYERFRTLFTEYFIAQGRPAHLKQYFPTGPAWPAESFRSQIQLFSDRTSDIFNINCTANSPAGAYALCHNFMRMIEEFYPEVAVRDTKLKREFITRQIKSYSRQVKETLSAIVEFDQKASKNLVRNANKDDEIALTKLRDELSTAQRKLEANRMIRQNLLKAPVAKSGELLQRVGALQGLTERLAELRFQTELLGKSNTPNKEQRRRSVQMEMERLTVQLKNLGEEDMQAASANPISIEQYRQQLVTLDQEYSLIHANTVQIEKQINDIRANQLMNQPEKMEFDRLQNELTHRKNMLSILYQREQESALELAGGNGEVFKLSTATQSGKKISPILSKTLFSALSSSIFLVLITLFGLIFFCPRLDSETEVNQMNLPILGKIPTMPLPSRGAFEDIPSIGFEYLRIMNYRILRETKDMRCPVLVVSSCNSNEGKSTVVQLLALASQAPGRKTLVLDGDLLTAYPSRFFNIPEDATSGVKSLIEDSNTIANLQVSNTLNEGIYLVPRGGRLEPSSNPDFLNPVKKQLELWRREYNLIIIDTPPLFATNLALQWAGLADLAILVARLYVTSPKDVTEGLQTMKLFTKAPIGVALNGVALYSLSKRSSHYYFSRKTTNPTRIAA